MAATKINRIIAELKKAKHAVTIVVGNQKGGVGKTTNTYMIAYTLAKLGLKTLVVDLDPQANSTKTLVLTRSRESDTVQPIDKTLMRGVEEGSVVNLPVKILPNLFLLPSYIDFQDFTKYLYKHTKNEFEETHLLQPLFEPLKADYDIILLDVPPFSIEVTNNAVMFSDYALISLQTHDDSLTGAEEYVNTLARLNEKFNLNLEIIGILPMLHDARNGVDQTIIQTARQEFGEENVFSTIVPQMARIKRFPISGITERDRYDGKVIQLYQTVTNEFLTRLGLLRGVK
ncbi:ParA family protein [Lacticaseibacillus sp. 53-4]|uniref:ParA family protein n=1 Tax=Lacticaseibacillus sp. 53-4 TaxID=2799575 RepID=UPI001942025E|nr:ParA family protein [Lacticaseibacillus sp. 53-4]